MSTPADQTAFVNTGGTGHIDLGNNFPAISFNNSNPFSFEVWVRIQQLPTANPAQIFLKSGEFSIGWLPGGQITLWRGGMTVGLISSATLPAQQWVHIGTIFDGQKLTLYLDGVQDSFIVVTSPGVPNQGQTFQLGNGGNMDIDNCRMWSIAQTSGYMYQAPWAPQPAALTPGLVANYDLSIAPPSDISGHANPLTLNSPARSMLSSPGVLLNSTAYVDPVEQDLIRCGDTAYTVDAWIYLNTVSGQQTVFSSGNLNDPGTVSLWLDGGTLKSQRGTTILVTTAGSAITAGTWTHIATTYDGITLSVYINGVAVGSLATGPIPSLIGETALLGACSTAAGGQANFLQGYIQYISVWTIALSTAQIQALMYQDPTLTPGCLANFTFSQTPPVDLNTGMGVVLANGASLREQTSPWSPSSLKPATKERRALPEEMRRQQAERLIRRADRSIRALCGYFPKTSVLPTQREHISLLLAELAATFPQTMCEAEREELLHAHESHLSELAAQESPRLGSVTHAEVDGYHVLTFHGPNGPEEVLRAAVGSVDPCTLWWIQLVYTILLGVAAMLGFTALVSGRAMAFAQSLVADLRFMAGVMPLFTGVVTAQTVLSFLGLLYNNGLLGSFLKFCFTQLSWWAIGDIALRLAGLVVPAPSPAKVAFVVAAAALVYNLIQLLSNNPCTTQALLDYKAVEKTAK